MLLNPELINLAVKILQILIQALKKAAVSMTLDFLKNAIKLIIKFVYMKTKKGVIAMFKLFEDFTKAIQVPETV